MKYWTLLFVFTLMCNLQGISQSHSFIVRDTEGDVISFLYIASEKGNKTLMSNNEGIVTLQKEDFADEDVLIFQSMFYEPLSIEAGKLMDMKEVVLSHRITTIPDIVIKASSEKDVNKLVKEMSKNFSKNTAKDYAAEVTWLSTVECNGKYREFMGYQGLFASCNFTLYSTQMSFDDKNLCYWIPFTVMKSDQLAAGSDDILETRSVTSGAFDISGLKIRYVNFEDDAWIGKRALEMYSPLNPSQINNFTYSIDSIYDSPEGEITVIHFKNKPGTFPRKTKIIGQGFIHCLREEARPVKIVTENIEDHYTNFPRIEKGGYPSVTHHRVEVMYGVSQGKIYTSTITINIDWVDPGVDTGDYYSYSQQRRRNPIGNKLREYRHLVFSNPVLLNKKQVAIVENNMRKQSRYTFILTAPFDRTIWENTTMYDIDKQRLFRDLNVNGLTLYEQAEKNAFADNWIKATWESTFQIDEQRRNELKSAELNYYTQYKPIYRILYGKDYE